MEPRLSFVTLGVRDVARARAFYAESLGLRQRATASGLVLFDLGGVRLALLARDELAAAAGREPGPAGASDMLLSLNVGDRHEVGVLLERAVAGGATCLRPAAERAWGGVAGFFADPDGHAWEIAWNPQLPAR